MSPLIASWGDVRETIGKDGKALGLPVTLVAGKDGCELGAVEGGAKWDSAEAQALVAALKGGRASTEPSQSAQEASEIPTPSLPEVLSARSVRRPR
jgi:hypothetical protein